MKASELSHTTLPLSPLNLAYPYYLQNEAICASAIYYYSSENITASSLAFRRQLQDTVTVGSTVQDLGSVETREGRLITFPNILQHEVQPFKLEDPTKPGHRKILALFLVDPSVEIISTADVPVQRLDWWAEKVMEESPTNKSALQRLPEELKAKILSEVEDFPIGIERAKEFREELMAERMDFELENEDRFESVFISLCEH
ncbi:hypothetical protein NMY22_g12855 [Coprinellus aureogranulatus]|nr:hypothetical protein NMY22_g12855 [Coprinellus aureogranulatus]